MVQYARRNAERQANMCVAAPTTPAQLFHILRRQMNRPFAQPLVLMTPKRLHVHTNATSALQDFVPGTFFNRVIDDSKVSALLWLYPSVTATWDSQCVDIVDSLNVALQLSWLHWR